MPLFHSAVNDTNFRVQQTFDFVIVSLVFVFFCRKKASSEDLNSVRVISNYAYTVKLGVIPDLILGTDH